MNKSLFDIVYDTYDRQARKHALRHDFADDTINTMTPLELLQAISDAIDEMNRQSAES